MENKVGDAQWMNKFPILQTERLTLRELRPEDARAIFSMRSNKAVNRFIARQDMTEASNAEELVEKTIKAYHEGRAIAWAGLVRENEQIIGTCGFNKIDRDNHWAEIGGELSTEFWGRQLAFEAVQSIVNYGFTNMDLHRIEAFIDPRNRGAIAIMEALNFQKEAHFREKIFFNGSYMDMAVYARIGE